MDFTAPALLFGFAFLGAGVKYVDSVFDEHVFNRNIALVLAGVCGIVMGLFVAIDTYAATVLLAIVLGVAITRKIDNPAFIAGTILVIAIPVLLTNNLLVQFFPLAGLVFGGMVDELGNNMVDAKRIRNRAGELFFHFRLTMEAVMGALVAAGVMPALYWAALIFFDISYHLVGGYAERVKMAGVQITKGEDAEEVWVRVTRTSPAAAA